MENWEQILIAIVAVLVAQWLWNQFIDYKRDVSDVYLEQQATISPTRKPLESAAHTSSKLVGGIRAGLAIRYDHYKIRNGNMRDIWEIYLNQIRKIDPQRVVQGQNWSVRVDVVNASAEILGPRLLSKGIDLVEITRKDLFGSSEAFVTMIACFVNQIPVHVLDSVDAIPNPNAFSENHIAGEKVVLVDVEKAHLKYTNHYEKKYDRGVALTTIQRIGGMSVTYEYTQLNFASAIAAFVQHLPEKHALNSNDVFQVVVGDDIADTVGKVLATFVTALHLQIYDSIDLELSNASIISTSEAQFNTFFRECVSKQPRSLVAKLSTKIKVNMLSKGIFPYKDDKLRLVYLRRLLGSKPVFSLVEVNRLRAILGVRIVVETVVPGVVGAILATDFYDYRVINTTGGYGSVAQADEIKLVVEDGVDDGLHGEVYVRGYNIGRLLKLRQTTENEGYMPTGVSGRWGSDGCLYI